MWDRIYLKSIVIMDRGVNRVAVQNFQKIGPIFLEVSWCFLFLRKSVIRVVQFYNMKRVIEII